MKHFILGWLIIITLPLFSQLAPNAYWIQFTNKNNSLYSLNEPEAYLSQRAIERRERYQIAIDSTDLPVNRWYLDSVEAKGANIIHVSKWLNGCAVYTTNPNILEAIYQLDFVSKETSVSDAFTMRLAPISNASNLTDLKANYYEYGDAASQINLHHGFVLHNNGYRGEGMLIALLDAGYSGLDTIPAFDSLFVNGQIRHTWDFVENNSNVYNDHNHGKACLSTIAANLPGEMVGSAPKANFLLYRTENAFSEFKIEEINWVVAAEMSDSIGADIISSSLGYQRYDSPSESYEWNDLDGQTAPITKAANMAGDKGILVFISAGNEGSNPWTKITAPADAQNVLTVGACNISGTLAGFSSRGNTADGRIKPDIVSVGQGTCIIRNTEPAYGNGTSFSNPLVTGLCACLWQADKSKNNFEMMDLIRKHSSQYNEPDSLMGYGIPNFKTALNDITQSEELVKAKEEQIVKLYPSPFTNELRFRFFSVSEQNITFSLENLQGTTCISRTFRVSANKINDILINHLEHLPKGIYLFSVKTSHQRFIKKIIKE